MSKVVKTGTIAILSIACYWVSLSGQFVFDDTEAIVNNKDVITETSIGQVFVNDFWGTNMNDSSSHKSYRPITILAFRLIRQVSVLVLADQTSPLLFHICNLMAYVTLNLLLWSVLDRLFQTLDVNDCNDNTPFVITVLFACHPIHSEVVCACVGLADLLSSILVLTTISFYILITNEQKYQNYVGFTLSSIIITCLTALAMLTKEQGLAAIGLCVIFDVIIIMNTCSGKSNTKLIIYRICCLSLGSIALLLLRLRIMNFKGPQFQPGDNPSSFETSFIMRTINYNYIYAINAWILLLPDWLCFDWSMSCINMIKSPADFRLVFVLLFWLTLLLLIRSSVFHPNPVVKGHLQIGLAFALVPFIPSANIFFTVGFVVAERALFLSSVGYIIVCVTGINVLRKLFKDHERWIRIMIIFFTFILAVRTFRRSLDWVDETRLFQSGLKVCPSNAKVHYNIAKNSADLGLKDQAIEEYREAIRLNPTYEHAFNNLANIIKDMGNLSEAQQLLLKAVDIRPTFATAWMNLAIVQTALKQYGDAETSYLNALKHRQRYADCYYNLGNLYVTQKRFDDAFKVWRKATQLKPKLLPAWNNLIIMLDNVGDLERARLIGLEALHHHSDQSSVHFNYANALAKMKLFVDAERHFQTAIAMDPTKANYHLNLGVLYHHWKQYHKALLEYQTALQIDPNLESAHRNIKMLSKSLNNNDSKV